MPVVSTSALSSPEAMLSSLIGRSGGGDETQIDDGNDVSDDALDSPPPPPLPVRPTARGRLPSLPRVAGAAAGPWTPLSSPSPHKGDAEVSAFMAELERKAAEAEARLRRKEEENAALRQQIESYHIRWLQHEIRIKSLEEAFHEQLASLQIDLACTQMVRDAAARRARDRESSPPPPPPPGDRHGRVSGAEPRMKTSEDALVRRRGAEFRRGSQAVESGAAALEKQRPPWQPGVPNTDAMGDLKKLGAQFRAWKKEYKARLRKAKAEIDRDRRRRSTCWI